MGAKKKTMMAPNLKLKQAQFTRRGMICTRNRCVRVQKSDNVIKGLKKSVKVRVDLLVNQQVVLETNLHW